MASKIRKQIYLEQRQDRFLKRLAQKTGLSEAELIRNAIDQQANILNARKGSYEVWKEEKGFIKRLLKKPNVNGKRTWSREELHER